MENRGWESIGGSWVALDFGGVADMKLVDENGREFPLYSSDGHIALGDGSPLTPDMSSTSSASLDVSPVPPDVARNWHYSEKRTFSVRNRFDSTSATRLEMSKPVKLILDLPLERREVVVPFEFTDLPLPPS